VLIGSLERDIFVDAADRSSYKGVAFKTIYMAVLTLVSATVFAILLLNNATTEFVGWVLPIASILAFVCAMAAIWIPSATPTFGSIYCIMQGAVVGAVSALVEQYFAGVALMALLSTMGTFGILMVLYATGVIRVGRRFVGFVIGAMVAFLVFSLVTTLVAVFSPAARETLFGDSVFALVISLVAVLLASMVILLDLYRIDTVVKMGLHRQHEWRAAFSLIITLIWLYMEFVRFFLIISSRSRN
jgi:uncharacterized YccA/Bax inhibitor family protein